MTPLRAYRKERKLTLGDVAPELGVSDSQLSRIEREGTDSLRLALKLSDMTGAEPGAFSKRAAEAA